MDPLSRNQTAPMTSRMPPSSIHLNLIQMIACKALAVPLHPFYQIKNKLQQSLNVDPRWTNVIERMNKKHRNLFLPYLKRLCSIASYFPYLPIIFAFQYDCEHLILEIKKNNVKYFDDEKNIKTLEYYLFPLRRIYSSLATLAMIKNPHLWANSIQPKEDFQLMFSRTHKLITEIIAQFSDLSKSIDASASNTGFRSKGFEKLIAQRKEPLNLFLEGMKYLQALFASGEDWFLIIQLAHHVMPVERINYEKIPSIILDLTSHILCALNDRSSGFALGFLKKIDGTDADHLKPEIIAHRHQLEAFLDSLKALPPVHEKKEVKEVFAKFNSFFDPVYTRFKTSFSLKEGIAPTAPAREFDYSDHLLTLYSERLSIKNSCYAISYLIEIYEWHLRLKTHIFSVPIIDSMIKTIQDVDQLIPILRDREQFKVLLDGIKIFDLALADKVYQLLYVTTADHLDRIVLKWEQKFLPYLEKQFLSLKENPDPIVCKDLGYDLQYHLLNDLRLVVKDFYENYRVIGTNLDWSNPASAYLQDAMEDLNFWILCSILGPLEKLSDLNDDLFALVEKTASASLPPKVSKPKQAPMVPAAVISAPEAPIPTSEEIKPLKPVVIAHPIEISSPAALPPAVEETNPLMPSTAIPKVKEVPKKEEKRVMPELTSKTLKWRNFESLVTGYGYYLLRKTKGSHRQYHNEDLNDTVPIPDHDTLKLGTAKAILKHIIEKIDSEKKS